MFEHRGNHMSKVAHFQERLPHYPHYEVLSELTVAEQIRDILFREQDHQIALSTALGNPVPQVTGLRKACSVSRGQADRDIPNPGLTDRL